MDVNEEGGEVIVADYEERPGWYVRVDEGLDAFLSGPGERRSNGESGGEEWRCTRCGLPLQSPDESGEDGYTSEEDGLLCPDSEVLGVLHDPEPVPLSWANSAWVRFDEENDQILVGISVGDPRGAFVMRVERIRYPDAEVTEKFHDELRLSVPAPTDGMLHMPLTQLASDGYYRIGS